MRSILRRGLVIDGSGAPGAVADVSVIDGAISGIGDFSGESADLEVDLSGLILAPGFIDIHTHYDAQVLWDPDLSPSSWHGVTSVVMGNCGFGIAPLRAKDIELIRDVLCTVEGMPRESVILDREYPNMGAYFDQIRSRPPRMNVGALVGHCALRVHAMGTEALERRATPDEITRMVETLRQAMADGALGFATSRSPGHQGPPGQPVPSRLAGIEEFHALAGVLGDAGLGVLQITPGPDYFFNEIAELSERIRRPITWAALLGSMDQFGSVRCAPGKAIELLDEASQLAGEVWPQISCRPVVTSFTMLEPYAIRRVPAFKELLAMAPEDRRPAYAGKQGWRKRAERELDLAWADRWDNVFVQESARPSASWQGKSVRNLAQEAWNSPAAAMIDFAVQDNFETRYEPRLFNDDVDEVAGLLNDDRCVLGLSDAGAHSDQLCDAVFPTHLLGTWVRDRGRLSMEKAIWRLSGQPAHVMRIANRGLIREGFAADLVAFDPETVGDLPLQRVRDLPGNCERLVGKSTGIEHVWVNGTPVWTDGEPVEHAYPGRVLNACP
jgi:N-acyl-D-amino-acid deacylase